MLMQIIFTYAKCNIETDSREINVNMDNMDNIYHTLEYNFINKNFTEQAHITDIKHVNKYLNIRFRGILDSFVNEYSYKILSDMHIDKRFDEGDDEFYKGLIYYELPCDKKECTFEKPHIFKIYLSHQVDGYEFYKTLTLMKDGNETKTKYFIKKIHIDYNNELVDKDRSFVEYKPIYGNNIKKNLKQIDYTPDKIREASKQFYTFRTTKGYLFNGYPSSILEDKDNLRKILADKDKKKVGEKATD
jgi:hypothetical protein